MYNAGSLSRKNAQAILLQHLVLGTHFSPAFKDGQELTTAAERELLVGVRNGEYLTNLSIPKSV